MEISTYDRLFNRHLAKLLDNLEPLNIPEIQKREIKRSWRNLQNDIREQVIQVKQVKTGDIIYGNTKK